MKRRVGWPPENQTQDPTIFWTRLHIRSLSLLRLFFASQCHRQYLQRCLQHQKRHLRLAIHLPALPPASPTTTRCMYNNLSSTSHFFTNSTNFRQITLCILCNSNYHNNNSSGDLKIHRWKKRTNQWAKHQQKQNHKRVHFHRNPSQDIPARSLQSSIRQWRSPQLAATSLNLCSLLTYQLQDQIRHFGQAWTM